MRREANMLNIPFAHVNQGIIVFGKSIDDVALYILHGYHQLALRVNEVGLLLRPAARHGRSQNIMDILVARRENGIDDVDGFDPSAAHQLVMVLFQNT